MLLLSLEPFELARHSSTSSNECIEHGGGSRANFESELEEYEEDITETLKENMENVTKSLSEDSTATMTEDCDNDRKRFSSSVHNEGKFL